MNYILSITPFNDNGRHAAMAALRIAKKTNAALLLIDEDVIPQPVKELMALAGASKDELSDKEGYVKEQFIEFLEQHAGKETRLTVIDEADINSNGKIDIHRISLIVKYRESTSVNNEFDAYEVYPSLSKLKSPVLYFSEKSQLKEFKKLAYITDIRYCDIANLLPLVKLCHFFNTELILIHVTASGLPDIDHSYAEKLLVHEIIPRIHYKNTTLINLPGTDTINDINNVAEIIKPDVIALSNRKYWFYDRLFIQQSDLQLSYINIPLLIFNQQN
ncbi:hypothetical protein GS399_10975 [Pedobacter sp. HMF7647]|uniref:Universal stress protein n=1 Tax=Hufsiella arboris TaxID=2695275 RepID=A0A7K1YAA0_9SPHI|nr:hypothetical protein [Hufsiella arboris]MXV51493.1 hypothetical protein [Hufsiella arboris]